MKTYGKSWLAAFAIGMTPLATSCRSTKSATQPFCNGSDSVKVTVSTKVGSDAIVLNQERKAIVLHNGQGDRTLSAKETHKLKSLAVKLFVEKRVPIILSEEEAYGRTDHPIFTVTLYNKGKATATRYDMGDEDHGTTQTATKRIRYSETFRDFMFTVLHITH